MIALTRVGHRGATRCPWPTTAPGGVLRCVTTLGRCTEHRAVPRPLVHVADVLWSIKPWWPNAIGRQMDREGRARRG